MPKIYEATNGEKAIHQAQTILPDLIIMDIQMPIMNGYESDDRDLEKYHN